MITHHFWEQAFLTRPLKGEKVMGRHHQPQTVVIVPVVRVVVVAIRRGGVILIVVEGTAPQHLPGSLTDQNQPIEYITNFQNRLA